MTQRMPFSDSSNKHIEREQLDRIIEAILAGKYSWACFLLLRYINYDPLHYMPYTTYNRLVKENRSVSKLAQVEAKHTPADKRSSLIQDLEYLEAADRQNSGVRGGILLQPLKLNSAAFEPIVLWLDR